MKTDSIVKDLLNYQQNKTALIDSVCAKLNNIESEYTIPEITAFVDFLYPESEFDINNNGETFCYTDDEKNNKAISKNNLRKWLLQLRNKNSILHKPIEALTPKLGESNEEYRARIIELDKKRREIKKQRDNIFSEIKATLFRIGKKYRRITFPELSSEKADKVLNKCIKLGYLNALYQPTCKTNVEKAVLAKVLADLLDIQYCWKCFEKFWGLKNLKVSYKQAHNQYLNKGDRIKEAIKKN